MSCPDTLENSYRDYKANSAAKVYPWAHQRAICEIIRACIKAKMNVLI